MSKISRPWSIAISLVAILSLTPQVSFGQSASSSGPTVTHRTSRMNSLEFRNRTLSPKWLQTGKQVNPDLLLSLPNSDALITVDVKRVIREVLPHLLADEPALRPLVMSLIDLKALTGLDPQAVERVVIGLRYARSEDGTSNPDFSVVAIAQSSMVYSNRGYALTDKEEINRAIIDFDKSLTLNPKLADAYNGRGRARFSKEEFEQSIADYDKAISLAPNDAIVYGNRALGRLALRMDAEAAQDLKKCFELDESMRPIFEPLFKEIKKTRRPKPRRPH
ncbi:MAG TPA: tetratricopeptide repeat protein [Pyrinomonadaceae bacterium]|nr:tetratricopeptide repeat protein [Pyrinomonadaceae bacterium]